MILLLFKYYQVIATETNNLSLIVSNTRRDKVFAKNFAKIIKIHVVLLS